MVRNPDDAQEWLRSWSAQVSAQAGAAAELSERVAAITASASGADGAVRVTVASTGAMTGLELDDRVQRMPGAELARAIMATVARAQARLADQVASVVAETVGATSETGRAVVESYERRFPDDPDEPENRDYRHGGWR